MEKLVSPNPVTTGQFHHIQDQGTNPVTSQSEGVWALPVYT
jgi:hypothetical protein